MLILSNAYAQQYFFTFPTFTIKTYTKMLESKTSMYSICLAAFLQIKYDKPKFTLKQN